MEKRIRVGRRIVKISVLVVFALSLITSPTWAQTGTVSGKVVDADGEPFAGVVVRLQSADGSIEGKGTTSDANGFFRIPGVAPGTYRVSATADGFQPASQAVEMTESGDVAVDFEMNPAFRDKLIVSAQRVDEDILDVPMTISAFDTQSLTEMQIQNPIDLQDMTPGLQFGDQTYQDGQGTVIRGIGTRSAANSHADLGVATYVDGAYTLGTYGVAPGGAFDMARVEVARGPQGTLHGRNSVAGSINLVTIKPEDRWDATFMGEYTDVSQYRVNGAIGGPLGGPFSFRLTAGTHQGDGRQENIGPADDLDAPDQTFYAPQLRITSGRFDMNMRWSHVEDNGLARSQVWLTNVDTTTPLYDGWYQNPYYLYGIPNPAIDPDCPPGTPGHLCGDLYNKVATNFPGSNESVSDLGTAYASYQISDNINVRYNGSYSDVVSASWADSDFTAREALPDDHTIPADAPELGAWEFANTAYYLPFEYQEMSHELTFTGFAGNFNYVGGLFYYENDRSWTINSFILNNPWRFMTADEHAQANSPLWDFWPAEGCQDTLAMIEALGYGTADPSQAHNFEGLYYYCPSGSDHSQTLEYFTQSSTETKAAFFSGNYRFNANWALSGGLRYTEDTKSQTTAQQGGFFLFEFGSLVGITFSEGEGFAAQGFGDEASWSRPIGHLALEYSTDTGQLIYGRISTGYRAGGFNLSNVPGSVPPFIKEETLVNYELGTKGAFFNSRLQLAAGVWYYDFQDYQLAATMEQPPGVLIPISQWDATPLVEYTANIPDTNVWGLDLEFSSYIGNHWMLRGFYAYQDSEIGPHSSVVVGDPDAEFGEWEHVDFESGQVITSPYPLPTDQTGNSLPMQPKNKLALTGGFNSPLGQSGGDLQLFATYSYTDERYADIGNLDYWVLPSYDRWDASIAWTPGGGKWTVALFGKNLTNEIGIVELNPELSAAPALGYLTHAREIGLQLFWRPFN